MKEKNNKLINIFNLTIVSMLIEIQKLNNPEKGSFSIKFNPQKAELPESYETKDLEELSVIVHNQFDEFFVENNTLNIKLNFNGIIKIIKLPFSSIKEFEVSGIKISRHDFKEMLINKKNLFEAISLTEIKNKKEKQEGLGIFIEDL